MQKNVLEYLEQTVKICPDKIAFSDGTHGLSFSEIYSAARSVGSFLCYNQRSLILVMMAKTPEMISAFLGVAYSGNVYVPLDSDMQLHRISKVIQKLSFKTAVCDANSAEILRGLNFEGEIFLYDEISRAKVDNISLETIRTRQIDTDPLYIVFTSGSTGEPKGVVANHRSVINYIDDLTSILGIDESTVFGNQTPLYLDASLKEVYSVLKCSAAAFLIPKSHFMFPVRLISYLNEFKINTICWVSSALSIVAGLGTFDQIKPEFLHTIAFGSEVFQVKQFNVWLNSLPNARFFNLYGPTEATGMSSFYKIDNNNPPENVIPIGRAFPNTDVFLAKGDEEITEPDIEGIIYIRGAGISAGYYDDAAKTSDVFVQNPIQSNYHEIVYNTGDVGKYNENLDLVYVCRNDFQIKRHGYRVELMEIEQVSSEINGVSSAISVYSSRFDSISMFFIGDITEKELLKALRAKLPNYMLPNLITKLDFIPKQDNHKIDRAHLLKLAEDRLNG